MCDVRASSGLLRVSLCRILLYVLLSLNPFIVFAQESNIEGQSSNNLLHEGDSLFLAGQYRKALKAYDDQLTKIPSGTNRAVALNLLEGKAHALMNMGQPQEAETTLLAALDAASQYFGEQSLEAASCYYYLGKTWHTRRAHFVKSLEYSQKALDIRKQLLGSSNEYVAASINMLATVHMYQGQYRNALGEFEEALNIWQALDQALLPPERSRTYYGIGWINIILQRPIEALQMLNKGLEINEAFFPPYHGRISGDLALIGRCYTDLGQYDKALAIQKKSLQIRKKVHGENHFNVAQSYKALATINYELNNIEDAIDYISQAIALMEQMGADREESLLESYSDLALYHRYADDAQKEKEALSKALDLSGKFKAKNVRMLSLYTSVANFELRSGNKERYDDYMEKALSLAEQAYGKDHNFYARILDRMARSAEGTEAISLARESLSIYNKKLAKAHPNHGYTRLLIARRFRRMDLPDSSLQLVDEVLKTAVPQNEDGTLLYEQTSSPHLVTSALLVKSQTLTTKYKLSGDLTFLLQGTEVLEEAMKLIERGNNRLIVNRAGDDLVQLEDDIHDEYLTIAEKLYQITEDKEYERLAFEVAERAKGMIYLKALDKRETLSFTNIPDSLVRKEVDLISGIRYYNRLRTNAFISKNEKAARNYGKIIFDLKSQRNGLMEQIEQLYPDFYGLKYEQNVLSLDEVQEKLQGQDRALIAYSIVGKGLFIHAVSADDSKVLLDYSDEDLAAKVLDFRNSYTNYQLLVNDPERSDSIFASLGHQLYNTLIEPISDIIRGKSELIIVADDVLHNLNFELLLSEKATDTGYAHLPYLLRDYAITNATSYTVHEKLEAMQTSGHQKSFGGFATDLNAGNAELITARQVQNNTRSGAGNAHNTLTEVEEIASLLKGDIFVNEEASEQNFKKLTNEYSIVHLAMHGNVDNQNPFNSSLIFEDKKDLIEDGLLMMNEVYDLQLQSDLVVLSACNSGFNDQTINGEGMASMSRGFMFSGIPSIVMSFWNIPDESTSKVMLNFYQFIKEGYSKPKSLQLAKLKYLNASEDEFYAHPYFWAGMSHMGNTAPLRLRLKSSIPYTIIGLAVLFIGVLAGLWIKKSRQQV